MAHHPPLSEKREKQLLEQIGRGDRGALGELLTAHHRQIYHLCLRMVSQRDDAAELTQDVLVKATQHIDSFKQGSRFGTWLYRIAMNLSISHLRKRKLRQAASMEAPMGGDDGLADGQAHSLRTFMRDDREPGPDQRVETSEQISLVLSAVERLDDGLKSVILLRDLQEMDYQQIAEVLGVPVGTVKSRLFRARLALRQEVARTAASEQNRPGGEEPTGSEAAADNSDD